MANSPQARKRAKQNTVRRLRNHSQRSAVRTAIKKLEAAIVAGDEAKAKEAYQASASIIDKATSKGLHHKNRAARLKSRLNKRVKEMAA
ncbi:MAG: 30S ribosomal protein S20 [Gammaproteobacteria bacterium]|nr:30S ribosomal protein S20 [Gammaproteobacteria bacterium]